MKNFLKVLLTFVLVLSFALVLVACGDEDNSNTNNNNQQQGGGTQTGDNDDPVVTLLSMNTARVRVGGKLVDQDTGFGGTKTYTADGTNKTLPKYQGTIEPSNASDSYEYWNATDTEKVAGSEGVSEPGTYIVHIIFTKSGYETTTVRATLIVDSSYTITYSGPQGMSVPSTNPAQYSLSSSSTTLQDPSCNLMKFKGWYLTSDFQESSKITTVSGSSLSGKGNITIYAKFQYYVECPVAYSYVDKIVVDDTLPNLPANDLSEKDSFCFVDMSLITSDNPQSNGFKYTNNVKDSTQGATYNLPVATQDGTKVLEWVKYRVEDYATNQMENEKDYFTCIEFSTPQKNNTMLDYSGIEYWIYSEKATGATISFFIMTDNANNHSYTYDTVIDWSGWKKFSLSFVDMYYPSGTFTSYITDIRVMSTPFSSLRSDNANAARSEVENRLFFSSFYLVNYTSSYNTKTSISDTVASNIFANLSAIDQKALMSDADVATAITSLTSGKWTGLTLAQTYEKAYKMASAFADKTSNYYQSSALANAVASVYNATTSDFRALMGTTLTDEIKNMCLNFVEGLAFISDYVSLETAKIWMIPVLDFFPTPVGGANRDDGTYIYILASLASGNTEDALNGIRAVTNLLTQKQLTLANDSLQLTRFTKFLSIFVGTSQLPDKYITSLFDWFTVCVDALTYDGEVPTGLDKVALQNAIEAMLVLYKNANGTVRPVFEAQVKAYLAADSTLEASIKSHATISVITENLDAIIASNTAAKEEANTTVIYEKIGQAVVKTPGSYYLIYDVDFATAESNYKVINIDTSVSGVLPEHIDSFYGYTNGTLTALVLDSTCVLMSKNNVYVASGAMNKTIGDFSVYIIANTSNKLSATSLVKESNQPVIVFTTLNEMECTEFTVYNFTKNHPANGILLYLNQEHQLADSYELIEGDYDEDLGFTTITFLQTPPEEATVDVINSVKFNNIYTFAISD